MKLFLIQILVVIGILPISAQNELAINLESGKSKMIYPTNSALESATSKQAPTHSNVDQSTAVDTLSIQNISETTIGHLVDQSTGLDSLNLFSDGTTHLDPTDPIEIDALFMSPNPTSGMVQIKLPGKLSIQVYTLEGKLVSRFQLATGERFVDLTGLTSGFYQVRVKSDEDYYSGKLLIQ